MKKLTEREIQREATNRNNYLQKKGGWRGFIEGALWMQELMLSEKIDIYAPSLLSDKFPIIDALEDGEIIDIEKLRAIGKENKWGHYNLHSEFSDNGMIKCILKADYQFAHRIGKANRDEATFYYKAVNGRMLEAWDFEKPSRTYDEILAEFNKGKTNTTS